MKTTTLAKYVAIRAIARAGQCFLLVAICGVANAATPITTTDATSVEHHASRSETYLDKIPTNAPDFACVGRLNGVPDTRRAPQITVSPASDDPLAAINHAIATLGRLSPDSNGIRGIVRLTHGEYTINSSIVISTDGILLVGAADGTTVLHKTGQGDAGIIIQPPSGVSRAAPAHFLTDDVVEAGTSEIGIERPQDFAVGDEVIIVRPSNDEWLFRINATENLRKPWTPGRVDIRYYRSIRSIEGMRLVLDAPILCRLAHSECSSYLMKNSSPYIRNVGVDHLRIQIDNGRVGVRLSSALDCWVYSTQVMSYNLAGFEVTKGSRRISLADCTAVRPRSSPLGAGGYAFRTKGAQLILFDRCRAVHARYAFVSAGGSFDSGIVFTNCTATDTEISAVQSTGHWAQAVLFDQLADDTAGVKEAIVLGLTKHSGEFEGGWNFVDSIVWNPKVVGAIRVETPPYGQNTLINAIGPSYIAPASLYRYQIDRKMRRAGHVISSIGEHTSPN